MPVNDPTILADLQKAALTLQALRVRLAGVDLTAQGAQEIGDVARSIACQAASIATLSDLAEGVTPRHANGLLKRVRKALGYTYP